MEDKQPMLKTWAIFYLTSVVTDLLSVHLGLSELINNSPNLSPTELNKLTQLNNELDKVIHRYLIEILNKYFD